jgi:predicted nucleic acid-binding protein
MIVLDASVAVKAYLDEPGSDEAIGFLTGERPLHAPELIRVEVAAALCRRVRRGELEASDASTLCAHWFARLEQGLFTLSPDRDLLADAVGLATELKHPLQDCLYLATARKVDAPLITADRSFYERASAIDRRVELLGTR